MHFLSLSLFDMSDFLFFQKAVSVVYCRAKKEKAKNLVQMFKIPWKLVLKKKVKIIKVGL